MIWQGEGAVLHLVVEEGEAHQKTMVEVEGAGVHLEKHYWVIQCSWTQNHTTLTNRGRGWWSWYIPFATRMATVTWRRRWETPATNRGTTPCRRRGAVAVARGRWRGTHLISCFQLSISLLDATVLFHKVVDEVGCVFVFKLLVGDPYCVQKLLPLWVNVATL